MSTCFMCRYWLDLTSNDVHWNLSDTGWAKTAWSNIFAPWMQGACVFVHNSDRFNARETLKVLMLYGVCFLLTDIIMISNKQIQTQTAYFNVSFNWLQCPISDSFLRYFNNNMYYFLLCIDLVVQETFSLCCLFLNEYFLVKLTLTFAFQKFI